MEEKFRFEIFPNFIIEMFQFLNYKHRKSLLSNFKLQLLAWTVIINAQTSIYRQRAAVKKVSPHEER